MSYSRQPYLAAASTARSERIATLAGLREELWIC